MACSRCSFLIWNRRPTKGWPSVSGSGGEELASGIDRGYLGGEVGVLGLVGVRGLTQLRDGLLLRRMPVGMSARALVSRRRAVGGEAPRTSCVAGGAALEALEAALSEAMCSSLALLSLVRCFTSSVRPSIRCSAVWEPEGSIQFTSQVKVKPNRWSKVTLALLLLLVNSY